MADYCAEVSCNPFTAILTLVNEMLRYQMSTAGNSALVLGIMTAVGNRIQIILERQIEMSDLTELDQDLHISGV